MTRVELVDQNNTHFATFDMPLLPRTGDVVEIGFANEQTVKTFAVERVVHQMVQLPAHENDPPWRWELRLHGYLYDPNDDWSKKKCICAQGVTKCPKHGDQPAERDNCPWCKTAVLGYCAEGVYCTTDGCGYVA